MTIENLKEYKKAFDPLYKEVYDPFFSTISYDLTNLMNTVSRIEFILSKIEQEVKKQGEIIEGLKNDDGIYD